MGFSNFVGFDNYIKVFTGNSVTTSGVGVLEMFWNSLSLSVVQTAVSMFFTCCAAYVLARFRFFGSKFLYSFIIVSSVIPTIAAISATYQFMTDVKLIGTFIGMVLLECGAFGGGFLYIHSYFKNIPWSFAESAMIDGAGDFKIFSRIMVPMAKNGILTFTILRFLGAWNSYWLPRLFYEDNPTLAVGLYKMSSIADNTGQHTVYFAAMIISIVPILIFYALFQKQLLSNTVDGGLK
jgi:N-acetylglucosamine transport system permease protein